MVARLSALRTRRALLPRNIIILIFLVLISVKTRNHMSTCGLFQAEFGLLLGTKMGAVGSSETLAHILLQCKEIYLSVSNAVSNLNPTGHIMMSSPH
jgi:hypothetical protein